MACRLHVRPGPRMSQNARVDLRHRPVREAAPCEAAGPIRCATRWDAADEPIRPRPAPASVAPVMGVLDAIADPILLLHADGTLAGGNRAAWSRLPSAVPGRSLLPPGSNEASRLVAYLSVCAASARPRPGIVHLRDGAKGLHVRCRGAWVADLQGGCVLLHLLEDGPRTDDVRADEGGAGGDAGRGKARGLPDRTPAGLDRTGHAERLRLARDLHDQSGHGIAALGLGIAALERHVVSPAGHDEIRRLRGQLDTVAKDLHRIAFELRPAALDDFGLSAALRRLLADWGATRGVTTDFGCSGHEPDLSSDVEIALFRLCQEALTNIAKHAGRVSIVSVALQYAEGAISLIVEDDGDGCPEGELATARLVAKEKFGIVGMRERIGLVGGTLEFESAPGAGTTLVARISCPGRRT